MYTYYLSSSDSSDDKIVTKYLELIKLVDFLDNDLKQNGRLLLEGAKQKFSLYTLQTLIKVIVELEDFFNLYLSYNILQLSMLRITLDHFDKFELQSLASSVR